MSGDQQAQLCSCDGVSLACIRLRQVAVAWPVRSKGKGHAEHRASLRMLTQPMLRTCLSNWPGTHGDQAVPSMDQLAGVLQPDS